MTEEPFKRLVLQRARLQSLRDQARERYSGGAPALFVAALVCETFERLILELLEENLAAGAPGLRGRVSTQSAVIAVGGTGRGELAPFSDVDLLFLHSPRGPHAFQECTARLVRDCWDAGLHLGHSVHTPADAAAKARRDPAFATALVEARLLWGDEAMFQAFRGRFLREISRAGYARFFHDCVEAREAERNLYGASERQLEPDVKRSPGGLRDIHLVRWLASARHKTTDLDILRLEGALSRDDALALAAAQQFLMRVRVDLHFAAGKAQDVLSREEQLRLAELHGVTPSAGQRPVERFMQAYFRHSTAVAEIARRFVERCRPRSLRSNIVRRLLTHRYDRIYRVGPDEIDVPPRHRSALLSNCESLVQLFELAGQLSVRVAPALADEIRLTRPLPAPDQAAARRFLSILSRPGGAGHALREMYAIGLLEVLLPEMTHARCLLQFNQYHAYTVDEHSLRAVEAAEQLESDQGPLGTAYRKIPHKDILHLALLMHDLGKGYEEDHSDVGRDLALAAAGRFGLSAHQTELLTFLVHKHLLMAHLAFRRDFNDRELLARFSRDVGSPELLQMLYVLTAADVSAVGPSAWTGWKAELLTELYNQAVEIVGGGPPEFGEEARLNRIREAVRLALLSPQPAPRAGLSLATTDATVSHSTGPDVTELDVYPLHYLTGTSAAQIAQDLMAVRGLASSDVLVAGSFEPGTNTVEYRVYTRDQVGSGLFSKITGALTARGLAILSASICTTSTGYVVDSFRVVDADFSGPIPDERLRDVEQAIADVVRGKRTVEELFQRHRRLLPRAETMLLFRQPTHVVVDNDSAERFTIIDVFAHDRRGLLYTIAAALFELRLSIFLAKIATHIDQVIDVFYVTDREGVKIHDEARLAEIRQTLVAKIEDFERRGTVACAG